MCGVTQEPRPAASAAMWQTRFNCRGVIGSSGSRPGNTQRCARGGRALAGSRVCSGGVLSRHLS